MFFFRRHFILKRSSFFEIQIEKTFSDFIICKEFHKQRSCVRYFEIEIVTLNMMLRTTYCLITHSMLNLNVNSWGWI